MKCCFKSLIFFIILCLILTLFMGCSNVVNTNKSKTTEQTIKEYQCFNKEININPKVFLPSDDILRQSGNGMQLIDDEGNLIKSDTIINGVNFSNCFLRVTWLENYEGNLSIVMLLDDKVQEMNIDDNKKKIEKYDFKMDSKSAINIPVGFALEKGRNSDYDDKSSLVFLLMYNDENKNSKDNYGLKNSCNALFYNVDNATSVKDCCIVEAKNYQNQIAENADLVNSGGMYFALSNMDTSDYYFNEENNNIDINEDSYLYVMGNGTSISMVFDGDYLINAFDYREYLLSRISSEKYVKQKVLLPVVSKGEELLILNIEQSKESPSRYKIQCLTIS